VRGRDSEAVDDVVEELAEALQTSGIDRLTRVEG
jgi:hypothetical protein